MGGVGRIGRVGRKGVKVGVIKILVKKIRFLKSFRVVYYLIKFLIILFGK